MIQGKGGAGVVFPRGGDVVVPHDVVEVVAGDECFGDGFAGGELSERIGFPAFVRAAVFVLGGNERELGPALGESGVVACVGEFDADGAGVEIFEALPLGDSGMTAGSVEGTRLIDGAVAVDDEVSAGPFGGWSAPKLNGGFGAGSAGEMDDEEATHGHFRPAGERTAEGGFEPVVCGDVHGRFLRGGCLAASRSARAKRAMMPRAPTAARANRMPAVQAMSCSQVMCDEVCQNKRPPR